MNFSDKSYFYYENVAKKKSSKGIIKIVIISFLLTAFLVPIVCVYYFFNQLNKIDIKPIPKSNQALGIQPVSKPEIDESSIINIALLGTDKRKKTETGRSDTIIIATLDFKHKDIKLSSIMRDSYVKIERHGFNKITHAYAYGGPSLTLNTINQNFNLDLRDYISIDFFNLKKLIDIAGGINIDIDKEEIASLNKNMAEISRLEKSAYRRIQKPGLQKLDGNQALAYARIRDVGNGDYERTLRQRKIMMQLFTQLSSKNSSEYPYIVSQVFPLIQTSMTKMDILKYSSMLFYSDIKYFKQARFPVNNSFTERRINGTEYIVPNISKTTLQLHQFIFEDMYP